MEETKPKSKSGKETKKILDTKDTVEQAMEDLEKKPSADTGGKFTSEKIAEKVSEEKPEPKPKPTPIKKVENRNVPCMLRFTKVTAKQAASVVHRFKKSKYTDYTISHAKGHNMWDILVRFKNLDERDEFEKWINSLL